LFKNNKYTYFVMGWQSLDPSAAGRDSQKQGLFSRIEQEQRQRRSDTEQAERHLLNTLGTRHRWRQSGLKQTSTGKKSRGGNETGTSK